MKFRLAALGALFITLIACTSQPEQLSIDDLLSDSPAIEGKKEYLPSPYVTAGNRVYMVGHQDGAFPELGWHIKGEMGGIWNHPIKLMDGFDMEIRLDTGVLLLDKADSFINYPFANVHQYSFPDEKIKVKRWQFVPDDTEGLLVQLEIQNNGQEKKQGVLIFTGYSDLSPTWLGERTNMIDGQDQADFNGDLQAWVVKDSLNPWFVAYGATLKQREILKGLIITKDWEAPIA